MNKNLIIDCLSVVGGKMVLNAYEKTTYSEVDIEIFRKDSCHIDVTITKTPQNEVQILPSEWINFSLECTIEGIYNCLICQYEINYCHSCTNPPNFNCIDYTCTKGDKLIFATICGNTGHWQDLDCNIE
ncbi:MAG: hypothetical protein R2806_24990, partial [Saprospiraceae bacterium]